MMKNPPYDLIYRAGYDAGDENMEKAGRTSWNREDYNVAIETTNKLSKVYDARIAAKLEGN